jgi:hypothetical protein
MTSALPPGSSLDTGGVPPVEAQFDEGRPATGIRSGAFSTALHAPQLKLRLKHDGLDFPNSINQLRVDPRQAP